MFTLLIPDELDGKLHAILRKDDHVLQVWVERDEDGGYALLVRLIDRDTGSEKLSKVGFLVGEIVDTWLSEQPS